MTDDRRVLIVDDEPDLAELYAIWLGDASETTVVNTGAGALDCLDDAIDVVLLDRRLPDMDGAEVLKAIAERDLGAKVVILSAVPPDADIIGMDIDTYLTKPVTKPELCAAVDDLLAVADLEEPLQELYALVEKRAVLEGKHSAAELDASEASARLDARISTLRRAIEGSQDGEGAGASPMAELSSNPMETD